MREALLIFRKDVRHLWPRIVFVEFCIGLAAFVDSGRPHHMRLFVEPLGILVVIACFYLLLSVMHEEKTTGDTRYWLTRPIRRRAIVIAKLLFIAAFLAAPIVIGHLAVLEVCGFPQSRFWSGPVWDVLLSVATASIAVWAIASVTKGLVQFIWASLLWTLEFLAVLIVLNASESLDWPGFEALRSDLMAAVLLFCSAAAICVMYTRRNRAAAIGIITVGAALVVIARMTLPWHLAFAMKAKSGQSVDSNIVRLVFDSTARKQKDLVIAPTFEHRIGAYIPVVLSGVPDGMQLIADRATFQITGRSGSWKSTWDRFGQLVPRGEQITDPYHQRVTNGPQSLYVSVDAPFYERLAHEDAHLRATVAFTLYGEPLTVPMAQTDRARFIPGAGFCTVYFYSNVLVPTCINALEPPQAVDLLWRDSPDNAWEYRRSLSPPSNPVDTGFFSFWYYGPNLGFSVPYRPREVCLQVRRPIAYFERTFDVPAIRLADYN